MVDQMQGIKVRDGVPVSEQGSSGNQVVAKQPWRNESSGQAIRCPQGKDLTGTLMASLHERTNSERFYAANRKPPAAMESKSGELL
jgi:hypothetical protein